MIAVVVVVVIVVAALAGAYFLGVFGNSGSGSSNPAWLFKGAYATFSGTTTYQGQNINLTISVKVLDFNATKILSSTYEEVSVGGTPAGTPTNTTNWEPLNTNFVPVTPPGYTLTGTTSATRTIGGQSVPCTVYSYSGSTNGATSTITAYISNSAKFPVEFSITEQIPNGAPLSIDLLLIHTNIPGLP